MDGPERQDGGRVEAVTVPLQPAIRCGKALAQAGLDMRGAMEKRKRAWLQTRGDAVRIRVRVQPRASRTEVAGEHGDALKIRVSSPPVDGAANDELERFIAKKLGVAATRVRVISGATARSKVVEVSGIEETEVERVLGG
jgi:uncharacterized protein